MEVINVSLDSLILDPNNYRLKSNLRYQEVPEATSFNSAIQKRTMELLTGGEKKRYPLIRDLIESLKINGYIRVDNILVKELEKDKYIVLEGNRRVAALRVLYSEYQNGFSIGKLSPTIFEKPLNIQDKAKGVEVVLASYENINEYLILTGLKHVSGNKKWEVYNRAKLLAELRESGIRDNVELARRIGIEKPGEVEYLIRGFNAIQPFITFVKDNNIGDNYNPYDKFMIFLELITRPDLRKWVGWNDDKRVYENEGNIQRFYNWILPFNKVKYEDNEEIEDIKIEVHSPIIESHKQVRLLSKRIDNEEFLNEMEEFGNFDLALDNDPEFSRVTFTKTLRNIDNNMKKINFENAENLTEEDKKLLYSIIKRSNNILSFNK